MTKKEIAQLYIEFLENGDINQIIKLFSNKGKVTSPIYGTKLASDFYKELDEDTLNSKLQFKGLFEEKDTQRIALYFKYNWTLKNNSYVEFEVVDIFEFDENNKIEHLKIIYDTVKSRVFIKDLK